MPELTPFAALRFTHRAGRADTLLAPPYDVLDADQAAVLRSRNPYNAVNLVLPEGSEEERYELARRRLLAWQADGVLAEDPGPAVYVYRQSFPGDEGTLIRFGLFAALRLTPFSQLQVIPHESTHPGPKRDRLALTLATRAQLSPVLLVAHDPEGQLLAALRAVDGPSWHAATTDRIEHTLWRVAAAQVTAQLCALAGSRPLLIADGHHRYETALAAAVELRDNVKASYIMACVVSDADPGLMLRPTHRTLARGPGGQGVPFDWLRAVDDGFVRRPLDSGSAPDAPAPTAPARSGSIILALRDKDISRARTWELQARAAAAREAGLSGPGANIASLLFDRLVLRPVLGMEADAAAEARILTYHRDPAHALLAAGASGAAFLLSAVSLADLRATAREGRRLPPKSTYFEPKVPSGLLFRPL